MKSLKYALTALFIAAMSLSLYGECDRKPGRKNMDYKLAVNHVLQWHTFLGGLDSDYGHEIAVDSDENIYITGYSETPWGNPVCAFNGGGYDAYVAKLDSSGNLLWNTFLGGSGSDFGRGIAVDDSGNVYVSGDSHGTWGSPVRSFGGEKDAFVGKLDSSGHLLWNTFFGESGIDYGWDIAVDGSGNVYVSGDSHVTWGSPVRPHSGDWDAFAAKLDSAGSLIWNIFLGGDNTDYGLSITIDESRNVYVSGDSYGTWGHPMRVHSGDNDAFAAKLDSSGHLLWNTFLGSWYYDSGTGIAVDGSLNVYVCGSSHFTWGIPVRMHEAGVGFDAFAAKLDSSGSLNWNTFLGGTFGDDFSESLEIDGNGNVYVSGDSSVTWDNPVRPHSGDNDAFAAKLGSSGSLEWNTFLGGPFGDSANSIDLDRMGNMYLTGYSEDTWGSPLRVHSGGGDADAFVVRLTSHYIAGTVTENGTGLSGVTMTGLPVSPITAEDGSYQGGVSQSWSGTAIPVLAGYKFTPPYRNYINISSDQVGQDYEAIYSDLQISGTVTENGSGLSGVQMDGLPKRPVTASDGTYYSTVHYGWRGIVVPVQTGYMFTPSRMYYKQVKTDQTQQDYRAELKTYTLSGHVSSGENGLAEVSMTGLPGFSVTAGNGNYSDRVDHGWSGTVVPALTGYMFTPSQMDYSDVTADRPNQDYTASLIKLTMSGTVRENNTGLSGVRLQGLPASPVTKVSGAYNSTVTYGWAGAVTPALSGYEFKPESRNYSNVTSDKTHQDYTALRIIYAPAGASAGQVVNRSLFQAEYINVLTWTPNPENQDAEITCYRIYQINGTQRVMLAERDGQTLEYRHRDVNPDASYRYALVAVTASGREGRPAYLVIQ